MTADLSRSAALDRHLSEAIAEFSTEPGAVPGQAKGKTMSRGLRRLKGLTESLLASLDDEADKVADELQQDHAAALDAVKGIKTTVGGEFKSAAADARDLLNQISNEAAGT